MSTPSIPDIRPAVDLENDKPVNLLVASIALEELGLAHIINAEAEKNQFVLGTLKKNDHEYNGHGDYEEPTMEELLEINKSIERVMRKVIEEETLLQFKLEDATELMKTKTTKHEHRYVATDVVSPTCADKGYTVYKCEDCGDEKNDDYVDALGHKYVGFVTEPTCTEDGYTTYTCSVCKNSYVDEDSYVDALSHVTVTLSADDVTYKTPTNNGLNGNNRRLSTTVTLKLKLSEGSHVTEEVEFTDLYTDNKDNPVNNQKTVIYEIGCFKVTVVITVSLTGNNNSLGVGGAAAEIIHSELLKV